jgi:hypothetical protein
MDLWTNKRAIMDEMIITHRVKTDRSHTIVGIGRTTIIRDESQDRRSLAQHGGGRRRRGLGGREGEGPPERRRDEAAATHTSAATADFASAW